MAGVAAFDADGTLWREDVGEAFLRHLVSLGWIRLPDGSDPYEAYERAVERDRRSGHAYAAQLQAEGVGILRSPGGELAQLIAEPR